MDHAGKSAVGAASSLRREVAWAMAVGSLRNTMLHHLGKNGGRMLYHWQIWRRYEAA